MRKPHITVLLLAAGNSSRLGRPKQLLKWKDSSLLQNAINTSHNSGASKVVLVLGAYWPQIISKIETNNIEVVRNMNWKNGLGNSIAFGMKTIMEEHPNSDAVLVMLADQPLIKSQYVKSLMNSFEVNKKQIIASTYVNRKFGVPVIFDKYYFEELTCLNDDEGAKHIITKHKSNVTAVDQDLKYEDIDTLDDYNRLFKANHQ